MAVLQTSLTAHKDSLSDLIAVSLVQTFIKWITLDLKCGDVKQRVPMGGC